MSNLVNYFRPDCTITLPDGQVLTPNEIQVYKNFYKKEIYDKLQGNTVGKIILIWSNNLDVIFPALKAIWELGAAISVHDFTINVVTHPSFKNFYNHIDLIIGPPTADPVLSTIPHVNALETKMHYPSYADNVPPVEIWQINSNDYPDVDYQLNEPLTGDTVCCITHTSGTTGEPKIVKMTHSTAIDLVNENIKLFNFLPDDRVVHHKTLHHGSLFLNYAIPAFFTTDQHYWVLRKSADTELEFIGRCSQLCEDQKLTKWLIAGQSIRELGRPEMKSYNLSNTSIVTAVGPPADEMKTIINKHNVKAVYNNFGCTELGTLVVSKTQYSNIAEYSPTRFTDFNTLVDLEIFPTFFKGKFKNETEWRTIGDIVSIVDGVFFWHGRNTFLEFNQKEVSVSSIEKQIRDCLKIKNLAFSVVPDFELNCMYIAIFDKNLKSLTLDDVNQLLTSAPDLKDCFFSKLAHIDFDDVVQGIKPSQPVLLYYFRRKSN